MADAAGDYRAAQAQAKARREAQQQADQQWQKVLQANAGGKTGRAGYTTNFENAGGYKGLQAMIEHADPAAMMTVSSHWGNVAGMLQETAKELVTHVNTMLEHWNGESADAFRKNAGELHTSLMNGSQYATNTQGAMHDASVALTQAKNDFPAAPSEWNQITSSVGESDVQFKQDAAKYGIAQALKMDGGDLNAWERVHQEAVVVMESLGQHYNDASVQLSSTPGAGTVGDGGVWPAPPEQTGGIGSGGGAPRDPRQAGDAGLKPITGGDGRGHDNFTPGTGSGDGFVPGGGGITGVHGGQPGGGAIGVGGTLDGGPGGPHSGVGGGGGISGGLGAGGVGGLGGGAGTGRGGGLGGGAFGGMGGLGGAGLSGGGLGAEGGAAGESAAEKAALAAEGEGVAGGAEGEGPMGMGGMGGMGSQSGKKKQRKARAGYLVEDEETWGADTEANPGVITF